MVADHDLALLFVSFVLICVVVVATVLLPIKGYIRRAGSTFMKTF